MPIPQDRSAWAELIDGDIEWLLEQDPGLERDHIIEVLRGIRRANPGIKKDEAPATGTDQNTGPVLSTEEQRVIELYKQGNTGPEVAYLMGMKRSRVYRILREAKFARRRTGPRDGHGLKE